MIYKLYLGKYPKEGNLLGECKDLDEIEDIATGKGLLRIKAIDPIKHIIAVGSTGSNFYYNWEEVKDD